MKKLGLMIGVAAIVKSVGLVAVPTYASVNTPITCPEDSLNAGQSLPAAKCNVKDANTDTDGGSLWTTLSTIINVIVGALGVVAVIMIVLGGVQFVTAQGDASRVKKAKDTIMFAVIGLVVAILAWAIVNFVLGSIFKP